MYEGIPALSEFSCGFMKVGCWCAAGDVDFVFRPDGSHLFGLSVSHNTGLHMNQLFALSAG